ncbi:MAG: hydrogenase iron-sulfur subunit [Thermoplasmata archaeon]|nr:hydrogenase iron-sulfur subunit [Thermoplasmata archaeon]
MRIGVYVCHCGGNISDIVDVDEVAQFASHLPDVVVVRSISHMCSESGQKAIVDDVGEYRLDRVVVAACSPQFQGTTFEKTLLKAGLKPNMVEMANIREQSAWPHYEMPEKATEKAKVLTAMAVEKIRRAKPVERESMKIGKNVLVIGGGIAGIQASLDLANAGFNVFLVEKSPTIGGHMAQLSRTFPTEDCASCILTPKMADVAEHPNIHLLTYSEILEVSGSVGNFKVRIKMKPRYVDESRCTACRECEKVCPVSVPDEFNLGMTKRKAIYLPSSIATPHSHVIDADACLGIVPLRCGLCEQVCEANAINYDDMPKYINLDIDTIIVATGFDIFNAKLKPQYGYGKFQNVITALELERMIVEAAEGHIIRPIGKDIAFIQCVGSRDKQVGNLYCSRICCMYATKLASLLKRADPSRDIYIFYTDLRAYGKGFEEYYRNAQNLGIKFIRGRPGELMENPENKKVIVRVEDTLTRKIIEKEFDLVVLSVGLVPSKGTIEIAEMLKLPRSSDGFLKEAHPKFRPVDTPIEGIFVAGTAQGPKDIPDTVAQASAAAARAITLMNKGEFEMSPIKAIIDEEKCDGCGECIKHCPVDAIKMNGKAKINIPICKGCGACISSCPRDAIDLKIFSNDEIMAEIEAALKDKKAGEKRILIFADNICTYTLADGVGTAKMRYSSDAFIIRVPSSSRVTPKMMLKAFEMGADGIFLGECEEAVSPYPKTLKVIEENVKKVKDALSKAGIEPDRVQYSPFVTVMFPKFVNIANKMAEIANKYGNIPEEKRKKLNIVEVVE